MFRDIRLNARGRAVVAALESAAELVVLTGCVVAAWGFALLLI